MSFLDSLFDTLTGGSPRMQEAGVGSAETETVRKIVHALDALDEERAKYIASFAYILGRVAHADLDISDDETRGIERLVVERGGLPEEQAVVAVQIAKTQNKLFGGTEDFLVTREFRSLATREQKLALVDCLYALSAADEGISTVEDNEIGKIASELQLTRDDVASIRSAYTEHLNVLKDRGTKES